MVSAFVCPVVLAVASGTGLPWGLGLLPALGLLVIVGLDLRAGPRLVLASGTSERARLPTGFWLAWTFLVAVIAIEFSIVFWGATLIERQTGVGTEVATLLGGLFLGGMFVGRLGQSLGLGTGGDIRRSAAVGIVLAGTGAAIAWVSTSPALTGAALFLAGLGVAGLYPLGVAAALAAAPGRLTLAGTRLTLASGTAILVAPFASEQPRMRPVSRSPGAWSSASASSLWDSSLSSRPGFPMMRRTSPPPPRSRLADGGRSPRPYPRCSAPRTCANGNGWSAAWFR